MIKLIKGAEVFQPEYLGSRDLLVLGDTIALIEDTIEPPPGLPETQVIDGQDKYLVPGFIDGHQHIIGGGGEGGFKTRTPEIQLSDITRGGTTTVIGCLGTDSTSRNLRDLLSKARGLEEEGITTYIYTGSYHFPVSTITGSIEDDIILIDKVIGAGELALADHRSSQPTPDEFKQAVAKSRLGGMLSGKAGVVNVHIGDGEEPLAYLKQVGRKTEIPLTQMLPTHINRSRDLIENGIEYTHQGGLVDLTTSSGRELPESEVTKASHALALMLNKGVDIERITFSSDAQGSLPRFDENGNYLELGIGRADSLYGEVRDAVQQQGIELEQALKVITSNPARILGLSRKGRLAPGMDADLVLLDREQLAIDTVMARGQLMVDRGELIRKGTFE
ncbi:MAG: beta-aspartyl-peptidase [Bacillota bacterium]